VYGVDHASGIEELRGPAARLVKPLTTRIAAFVRSPLALDVAIALGIAMIAAVEAWQSRFLVSVTWGVVWPNALRGLIEVVGVSLPLVYRRRYPVAVLVIVMGVLAFGAIDTSSGAISVIIALFSSGLYAKDRGRSLAGLALVIGTFVLIWGVTADSAGELAWNAFAVAWVVAVWLMGDALRGRTAKADAMERRAQELERRRADDLDRATAAERARIARELHDVIAHNLSVVVIQAGAALRVQDDQPDAAREALRQVEATGRQAMSEMRRLLGVLRREDDDASLTTPLAGLAALPDLLHEIRTAGLVVTLAKAWESRELPPGVDVSAYRIIQEALTNVLKHAGRVPVQVAVRREPAALELSVRNERGRGEPARDARVGHGLIGMRERTALYGGDLAAGPRPGGGFALTARLPLEVLGSP
jgi:signal transduction histidine kinase